MAYMTYYRSQLTEKEKKAYDAFVDGVCQRKDKITTPKVNGTELHRVYFALNYDYPDFFYTDFLQYEYTTYINKIEIKMPYLMSYEDACKLKREIDKVAMEIVNNAKSLSPREAVEYFHDELLRRSVYSTDTSHPLFAHNLVGPFLEGKCVCEGYAKAFKYLCDLAGIKSILVVGKAGLRGRPAELHAWNVVRIGEESYHIDITFDEKYGDYISKAYFLLSDEEICRDHEIDTTFVLPKCNKDERLVPIITGTPNLMKFLREDSKKNKRYSEIRLTKHFELDQLLDMIKQELTIKDYLWFNRIDDILSAYYSVIIKYK